MYCWALNNNHSGVGSLGIDALILLGIICFLARKALVDDGDEGRYESNDNNSQDYEAKVVSDDRHIAEKEAAGKKHCYPKNASHQIVEIESSIIHTANSGYKRYEGPQYRDESAYDNSFTAMPLIEVPGSKQLFSVKKPVFFVIKNPLTHKSADVIVNHIAAYSSKRHHNCEQ